MPLIGIGEYAATKDPSDSVRTLALGSCVSVILLDPVTKSVGMVHVALPDSNINIEKASKLPGYFADTGISALLNKMHQLGCHPEGKGFLAKLVGGANVMDSENTFNIGKRNILATKKILWSYKLGAIAEDVGGDISRTVEVFVNSGLVKITSPTRETLEI